jgi:hypothetical protein
MAKKLTYEFVKSSFESEGYTLLSKEYKNSQTKLNYRCPNGHGHSIKWNDWQQGKRCPFCFKDGYKHTIKSIPSSKNKNKLDINYIRKSFEAEGYKLSSTVYVDSRTKLSCICPNGHSYEVNWNNWKQGYRCVTCSIINRRGKASRIVTFDKVKRSFEEEGYTLLSNEYKNNNTKLDYICPNGHKHSVTWGHWNTSKSRCPYCSKNIKYTIEYIRDFLKSIGYTLLSNKYISNKDKLEMLCENGHRINMSFYSILSGHRCPTCASINNYGDNNPNWQGGKSFEPYCEIWKDKEFKLDIMERDAYSCLNPYCDSKRPDDLTIHHIDYNKQNCHPSNLITVCRSCNSRANKNRKWHKAWYQAIMHKRYNYKY